MNIIEKIDKFIVDETIQKTDRFLNEDFIEDHMNRLFKEAFIKVVNFTQAGYDKYVKKITHVNDEVILVMNNNNDKDWSSEKHVRTRMESILKYINKEWRSKGRIKNISISRNVTTIIIGF